MMKRLFIDTNILFDALFNRKGYAEEAWGLFALGIIGKVQLSMSALTIVNAVYTSKKYALTLGEAKQKLLSFCDFIEVVDMLAVDIKELLGQDWKDYEDSVQNAAAMNANADFIISRNKKDYRQSPIPVLTSSEFLQQYKDNLTDA